jgi:phosphosulfolactate synthase (CoM biosynthesis protein A)
MGVMARQQELRRGRLNLIINTLKALGDVELQKFKGLMALNYGFRSDTTMEYLNELRDVGFIVINQGLVYLSDEQKKLQNVEVKKAETEVKELESEISQEQ